MGILSKLWGAVAVVGVLLGIASGVVQLGWIGGNSLTDAIWPYGVLVCSILANVVALVFIAESRRKVSPEDQELLDELLHIVNRQSVDLMEQQDCWAQWPSRTAVPISVLLEISGSENKFRNKKLEKLRAKLFESAAKYSNAEAMNGFPSRFGDSWRNAGYTPGEAEGMPEREEVIAGHRKPIVEAQREYLEVHKEFVDGARSKGFSVSALKREHHEDTARIIGIQEDRLPYSERTPSPDLDL